MQKPRSVATATHDASWLKQMLCTCSLPRLPSPRCGESSASLSAPPSLRAPLPNAPANGAAEGEKRGKEGFSGDAFFRSREAEASPLSREETKRRRMARANGGSRETQGKAEKGKGSEEEARKREKRRRTSTRRKGRKVKAHTNEEVRRVTRPGQEQRGEEEKRTAE